MPNWNYNSVKIHAPEHEVREWLTEDRGDLYFNMHRLFPERYDADDEAGHKTWNYDWVDEHT